jgi:hypothetical protein
MAMTGHTSSINDYTENTVFSYDLESRMHNTSGRTHMNPSTAVTLMIEKTNSASP